MASSGIVKLSAAVKENGTRLEAEVKIRRKRNGSASVTLRNSVSDGATVSAPKAITNSISTIMRALLK